MNIEKTVKGLHYCTKWESIEDCTECPYLHSPDNCTIRLLKEALATIDELQAEKENLKKENKYLRERLAEEAEIKEDMSVSELKAEIERLSVRVLEENHLRHQVEEMLADGMSVVKAVTVKKMQEKLKSTFCPDANYCGYDIHGAINAKAKELMGETK